MSNLPQEVQERILSAKQALYADSVKPVIVPEEHRASAFSVFQKSEKQPIEHPQKTSSNMHLANAAAVYQPQFDFDAGDLASCTSDSGLKIEDFLEMYDQDHSFLDRPHVAYQRNQQN